ncbi:MAG: glycogen/starch/alpha-glucan phosphorylase [Eubacterium sp.]
MIINGQYDPKEIYNMDSDIRAVLTQLVDGTYSRENPELFREIYNSLLESNGGERADQYFILKDFPFLCKKHKKRVEEALCYEDGGLRKQCFRLLSSGNSSHPTASIEECMP